MRTLILIPAMASVAVAAPKPAIPADRLNKAFADAFVAGDPAAMAQLYTEDAELLFFKGATLKGRPAIQAFFGDFLKGAKVKAMTITSEELHPMGGAVLDIGRYEITTVGADGKEETQKARYLQVWQKRGGRWQLFRDCPLPD